MATLTSTIKLVKPTIAEGANIEVINSNMDLIDSFVSSTPEQIADMSARLNAIEGAYVETQPVNNIANLGNLGYIKMYHRKVGKTVNGHFVVNGGTSGMNVNAPVVIGLPYQASAKYGDVEGSCLGSFKQKAGNIIVGTNFLTADRLSLKMLAAVTVNYNTGPWGLVIGDPANTITELNPANYYSNIRWSGTFTYEID